MTVDKLLWILAFVCFVVSFFRGFAGGGNNPFWGRFELVSLGLAFGALTFII
jgi:hypothetical protein